eukprot:CAMPEP_0194418668 /NCGR_PEP_ID=MMETSP0176-20130528/17824_1 /TAXON_ID=216777 /ORGANISM="Proboscia alata, Strain PI-D3" /LENGTH=313 /DNA_ID=CAMNT_0039225267 /DNA_START=20 /DNA_END=961 /DNA_ORIENTATION=-
MAATANASASVIHLLRSTLSTPQFYWACGPWSFFIAENAILSENRSTLISALGDDGYHACYGTISTAAMGSIIYGYTRKVRDMKPMRWLASSPAPLAMKGASFALTSLGLVMISQVGPKLQIPFAREQESSQTEELHQQQELESNNESTMRAQSEALMTENPIPKRQWKVVCPFDFTDSKTESSLLEPRGLDRISRHPGLWSMSFLGLGQACISPSLPAALFFSMPTFVALIGGGHTDSRHRRNMGGVLTADMDNSTSNVPFWAMIMGKQEGCNDATKKSVESFRRLIVDESKPLNAAIAIGSAALLILRRGR